MQKLISSAQAERAEGHKRWVAKHTGIRDMKRKAKILEMKRGEYTSEIATYFDNFFETAKAVVAARQPQEAAERERLRIAREARQAMKLKEHTGWINSFVKQHNKTTSKYYRFKDYHIINFNHIRGVIKHEIITRKLK